MEFDPVILERLRQENAQLRHQKVQLGQTVARLSEQVDQLTQELRQGLKSEYRGSSQTL